MLAKPGIEAWSQALNFWHSDLPWWLAVLLPSSTSLCVYARSAWERIDTTAQYCEGCFSLQL
ncbi:hypothetical protein DOR57_23380 [Salmonella enterica subsp. salamae]|uniref:Uncharacterized protein n=1 Tax=Salmonella enterica subsp. enterica serovar Kottbus TaxID=224727 RepID=A0A5W1M6N2_SALET|nr:hypothetical protein [Salmonella enterica subsp. enterica serovar Kottbus]ECG0942799.1 hypothetical protein [Salmonella enterica subsp. salamae]EBS1862972.1 hypothetical protein [Salmonella enterica subsp. enterica serovar Kottbus]EBW1603230.1 hypothetical protein [Salmonella enterica subsp. enterica serovar Kottbus]EBW1732470.1 hypothetical protein [Salmonella enterica subsp. enterica serovar Kottbus]